MSLPAVRKEGAGASGGGNGSAGASGGGEESGLVLVVVLLVLALLGLAMGASLWLTRAELWAAGRARAEVQAAYAAEAGIRHGLALLAPDVDWAAVAALEPEALADPRAPGPWPIGGGGWIDFPGPPFGYGLERVPPGNPSGRDALLVVRARATSVRGAAFVARASISRAARPYTPATVVLCGGDLRVDATALSGPGAARVEIRGGEESAAVGATSAAEATAASEELAVAGALVDGDIIDGVRGFDVDRFARRSGLAESAPSSLGGPVGAADAPGVLRIRGGSAPALSGAGVVLVSGDLDVLGDVDFSGAVYVAGRLRIGGAACRLDGMIWAGSLAFGGPCRVRFDGGAVADADRVLRLPRLPVLVALGGE